MITKSDAFTTIIWAKYACTTLKAEYGYYNEVIGCVGVPSDFSYNSGENELFLSVKEMTRNRAR